MRRQYEIRKNVTSTCPWVEEIRQWDDVHVKVAEKEVGAKQVVWIHSHQTGDYVPNAFVVGVNEDADQAADRAASMGTLTPVRIPCGLPRFFFVVEGKAVVENIGSYMRKMVQRRAHKLWCDRERQGAVARALSSIYPGILPLAQYGGITLEEDLQRHWHSKNSDYTVNLEKQVWKLRHYAVASYTRILHIDKTLEARIVSAEQATQVLGGEIRNCRVCTIHKGSHGTLRHSAMSCDNPQLVSLREEMWTAVENRLREAVRIIGKPCNHDNASCWCVGIWMRRRATYRPGLWQVNPAVALKWPILAHMGWLVPVTGEEDCVTNGIS